MPVQFAPTFSSQSLNELERQFLTDLELSPQPKAPIQHPEATESAVDAPAASKISRRIGAVAGVALAVATGTVAKVTADGTPTYEGEFQLSIDPITLDNKSDNLLVAQALRKNVSEPEELASALPNASAGRVKLLTSPRLLDPVVETLRAEDPTIDYTQLRNKLHITLEANNQVNIRYQDNDPEKVKQVLEKLFQRYQTYSQEECHDDACRAIEFIEVQIPQVQAQIKALQADIQALHGQHNIKNLPSDSSQFSIRVSEISKQKTDIEVRLADAQAQYALLKDQLALKPDDQTVALILNQDSAYQALLLQLIRMEKQMAAELGKLTPNQDQLQALFAQYQTVRTQIHQETIQVLQRHLDDPNADLQNPILQDNYSLALLQQSIKAAHNVQVLAIRRQTLAEVDELLTHNNKDLAALLRRDAELRQELQTALGILQQYQDELKRLQTESPKRTVPLQVLSAPELLMDKSGAPVPIAHNQTHDLVVGAAVGVVLGAGAAALTNKEEDTLKRKMDRRLSRYGRKPMPPRKMAQKIRTSRLSARSRADKLKM
ncbi:MAG: hypothetical protein QNJ46_17365 [Leptolyngbyaceae cyanobacterium MO_188.B28]|nr:hypothetical protein [Leptolyngbyaceae cyanobacterium MO_188.B28]